MPIVIVARTTPFKIPTVTPTSVHVQRRRTIKIAQAAATLCKPKICAYKIQINQWKRKWQGYFLLSVFSSEKLSNRIQLWNLSCL